jgi:hypothetical protein
MSVDEWMETGCNEVGLVPESRGVIYQEEEKKE